MATIFKSANTGGGCAADSETSGWERKSIRGGCGRRWALECVPTGDSCGDRGERNMRDGSRHRDGGKKKVRMMGVRVSVRSVGACRALGAARGLSFDASFWPLRLHGTKFTADQGDVVRAGGGCGGNGVLGPPSECKAVMIDHVSHALFAAPVYVQYLARRYTTRLLSATPAASNPAVDHARVPPLPIQASWPAERNARCVGG